MDVDLSGPDEVDAVAVLLHPHPHMGGDRFHPLVDRLFHRLPDVGVGAARFDLSSADPQVARDEVLAAMDLAADRWPGAPVLLVGYSFGAGVAAHVDDARVAGWFLVAPQAGPLAGCGLGSDERPKVLVVAEHDQFSPPDQVAAVTAGWTAVTVRHVLGDHFLGASLSGIVEICVDWVRSTSERR